MTNTELLETVQQEAAAWSRKNFPGQAPHHPLLGMVEEAGELWDAASSEDQLDALADVMIFAINLCTQLEINVAEVWAAREVFTAIGSRWHSQALSSAIGRIAHCYLKREQGIRGSQAEHLRGLREAMSRVFAVLEARAQTLGGDLVPVVFRIWREVVQPRSWSPEIESQLTLSVVQ